MNSGAEEFPGKTVKRLSVAPGPKHSLSRVCARGIFRKGALRFHPTAGTIPSYLSADGSRSRGPGGELALRIARRHAPILTAVLFRGLQCCAGNVLAFPGIHGKILSVPESGRSS